MSTKNESKFNRGPRSQPTSDTSEINTLYSELDLALQEKKDILDETHGDFSEKIAIFQSVRVDAIARAVCQRELALESVRRMYEYALYSADSIFDASRRELKDNMLKAIDARILEIQARISGGGDPRVDATSRSKRSLRSKAKEREKDPLTDTAVSPTNKSNNGAPPLILSLTKNEIMSDMKAIYRDWKHNAAKWREKSSISLILARESNGQLLYGNHVYTVGDHVVVLSELTRQEFIGTLSHINAHEIVVRLPDNMRCRVPIQHLRHGRTSLYLYNKVFDSAEMIANPPNRSLSAFAASTTLPDPKDPVVSPASPSATTSNSQSADSIIASAAAAVTAVRRKDTPATASSTATASASANLAELAPGPSTAATTSMASAMAMTTQQAQPTYSVVPKKLVAVAVNDEVSPAKYPERVNVIIKEPVSEVPEPLASAVVTTATTVVVPTMPATTATTTATTSAAPPSAPANSLAIAVSGGYGSGLGAASPPSTKTQAMVETKVMSASPTDTMAPGSTLESEVAGDMATLSAAPAAVSPLSAGTKRPFIPVDQNAPPKQMKPSSSSATSPTVTTKPAFPPLNTTAQGSLDALASSTSAFSTASSSSGPGITTVSPRPISSPVMIPVIPKKETATIAPSIGSPAAATSSSPPISPGAMHPGGTVIQTVPDRSSNTGYTSGFQVSTAASQEATPATSSISSPRLMQSDTLPAAKTAATGTSFAPATPGVKTNLSNANSGTAATTSSSTTATGTLTAVATSSGPAIVASAAAATSSTSALLPQQIQALQTFRAIQAAQSTLNPVVSTSATSVTATAATPPFRGATVTSAPSAATTGFSPTAAESRMSPLSPGSAAAAATLPQTLPLMQNLSNLPGLQNLQNVQNFQNLQGLPGLQLVPGFNGLPIPPMNGFFPLSTPVGAVSRPVATATPTSPVTATNSTLSPSAPTSAATQGSGSAAPSSATLASLTPTAVSSATVTTHQPSQDHPSIVAGGTDSTSVTSHGTSSAPNNGGSQV